MRSALVIAFAFQLGTAAAQVDPHFSQYYAFPLHLNPAMAGSFDGTLRATAIYRNQWASVSNPFSTAGLSLDVNTQHNISVGACLFYQTAGDAGYRFMNGSISVAYTGLKWGADESNQMVIGLQGGVMSRQFDPTKLQFGDQWTPATGYSPNNPTADIISQTSASAADFGVGIAYFNRNPDGVFNPFAGISINHLTRPEDPFLTGRHEKLPYRYTAHLGARIVASDNADVTPNVLYMRQGEADEIMLGATAAVHIDDYSDFIVGANYRLNDAVVPMAGFRHNNLTLGLSYDSNTSSLGKNAGYTNSFEISLSLIIPHHEYQGIPCPRF